MAHKRLKPFYVAIAYLRVCRGMDSQDIADKMGITKTTVDALLATQMMKDQCARIEEGTMDTVMEMQSDIQAAGPLGLSTVVELSLTAKNETVRAKTALALVEMAGHTPVRRVSVEKVTTPEQEVDNLTPEQVRRELLRSLDPDIDDAPTTELETVH